MELKGAEIVMETLLEQNVDIVFGYPGGTVIDIYEALYKYKDRLQHILTCHEQHAAHAADGYARASGKVGVLIATSGPGATNIVTGIANAQADSTPLVAITGNVPISMIGSDSFQEVDITGVTIPITKHNFIVKDIKDLADTIRTAFVIAKSGRPGPVLVDVPKNIQRETFNYTPVEEAKEDIVPLPPEKYLEKAAELIRESKKPYIFLGGGCVISGASEEILEFAKKIDSPLGATIMGLTAIPWDTPGFTGMMGMHGEYGSNWAISEADLIIAIGTRFSDRVTGDKKEFGKKANILHIDIDDAEIGKNISVYLHLIGDIKYILKALMEKVEQLDNSGWVNQVIDIKEKYANNPIPDDKTVRPWNVIRKLWEKADEDVIIATDVGQHQMWTAQYFRFSKPRTFMTSGGLGAMGFGMGAAMGAYIAEGKQTVLITGDGSFHMNLNELATYVTYNLPIVIIVFNNGVLGMVKQWQDIFYEKRFSSTLLNRKTDYIKLAEAFGAQGMRIEKPEDIDSVLDKALALKAPVVIDCLIDESELVLPMVPAGCSIKDIIMKREN